MTNILPTLSIICSKRGHLIDWQNLHNACYKYHDYIVSSHMQVHNATILCIEERITGSLLSLWPAVTIGAGGDCLCKSPLLDSIALSHYLLMVWLLQKQWMIMRRAGLFKHHHYHRRFQSSSWGLDPIILIKGRPDNFQWQCHLCPHFPHIFVITGSREHNRLLWLQFLGWPKMPRSLELDLS